MPDITTSAGIPMVTLQGTISNLVVPAVGQAIGQETLASSLNVGTCFIAKDCLYTAIVGLHPNVVGQRLWFPMTIGGRSDNNATASGAGATASHLGVYDPTTRVFTQATVSGQFCNARAATSAVGGALIQIALGPGNLFALAGATPIVIGTEVMSDAAGLLIPYVNNGAFPYSAPGTNVPLGEAAASVVAGGGLTILQYVY